MARPRLKTKSEPASDYFPKSKIEFVKTGCVLFDCMLGGGWPLGRISNLVGDKSTGKTLCAIEACANFARQYPEGIIWYREAEAAFDEDYAQTLGLPNDRIDFGPEGLGTAWETVEDIFEDMKNCIKQAKESGQPGLYIIDSLDALSSRAELGREIDQGSYGMEKQKVLGQIFRRLIRDLQSARIAVLIISQVREKIGISFGNKFRRSGGKALDFYASLVVYITHLKTLTRTIRGIKRPVAIHVKAKCEKNKITWPFRDCEFTIRFGYGIDELPALVDWLILVGAGKELDGNPKTFADDIAKLEPAERKKALIATRKLVRRQWREVESGFAPKERKYA